MSPVKLIIRRELREKIRSKAFLVTNVVLLVLVVAGVALPVLLGDDEPDELHIVTVDETGAAIAAIAQGQGEAFDYDITVTSAPDAGTARTAVADEEADVALLGPDAVAVREDPNGRLRNLLEGARRVALLDSALDTPAWHRPTAPTCSPHHRSTSNASATQPPPPTSTRPSCSPAWP